MATPPPLPSHKSTTAIKFLCSYGGKILPRYPDGKLRYHGGNTRLLAVDRSLPFTELLVKLGELCGSEVILRCQLPTEDLDALVSIKSDEDLANLIEEYDRAASVESSSLKIRAFLFLRKRSSPSPITSTATATASASSSSSTSTATLEASSPRSPLSAASYSTERFRASATNRCIHQISKSPVKLPFCYHRSAGKPPYHAYGNSSRSNFLVHNGNHWQ